MSYPNAKKRALTASKVVAFEHQYKVPRYVHVDKAIIHPIHEYHDPRVEKETPDLTLTSKKQVVKDKGRILRESMPQHLETPFVYVTAPPKKHAKPQDKGIWAPALQWKTFRQSKTQGRNALSDLGESTKEEREAFYEKNQGLKEIAQEFFDEVEKVYQKKAKAKSFLLKLSLLKPEAGHLY
jgi:hypothetical protein